MKSTRTILQIGVSFLLMCFAGSAAFGGPVSGTVLKAGGTEPLVKAEVELLRPGTREVVYRAYTDAKGRFALRQVAPGVYDLRVSFGRVLEQVTEGEPVRRQRFRVRQEATQLPTLRVR